MSDKVKCNTHGEQEATYVCQHIVQSMHTGVPVGFHTADPLEQTRPDAWCSACESERVRGDGDWTDELYAILNIKLLCGACYDHAKDIWMRGRKLTQ
jgi:hypothetical protein